MKPVREICQQCLEYYVKWAVETQGLSHQLMRGMFDTCFDALDNIPLVECPAKADGSPLRFYDDDEKLDDLEIPFGCKFRLELIMKAES